MNFKKPLIVATLGVLIGTGMLMSCGGHSDETENEKKERVNAIDSLVRARLAVDPEDALACVDSLEKTEEVSEVLLSYLRGTIYHGKRQKATAELYFEKSLRGDDLQHESEELFYKASDCLSAFYANRGDYVDALEVAKRAYEVSLNDKSPSGIRWTAVILHGMGYFQTQLGLREEAERNFSLAYMALSQTVKSDQSYETLRTYARVTYNILDAYTTSKQYDKAIGWVASAEEAADRLVEHPQATTRDKANYVGGVAIHKALVMLKMNALPSSEESYNKAKNLGYFDTSYGLLEQAHYLRMAERWDMLADMMPRLDSVAQAWDVPMSLHTVQTFMAPQLSAYIQSGRKDKALEVAENMAAMMDSVVAYETDDKMREISIIAAQKDRHTAEAEACAMQAWRWVKILSAVLAVLILCIIAYVAYCIIRKKKSTTNN
jgi:tetratricopeptide (TPR) repeat protein